MQAKNVSSGKLPMTEFEDPKLKGKQTNVEALKSILQIAVNCVSETREERPTIDKVYEELNNTWRLMTDNGWPINVPPGHV